MKAPLENHNAIWCVHLNQKISSEIRIHDYAHQDVGGDGNFNARLFWLMFVAYKMIYALKVESVPLLINLLNWKQ